jgi:RNA polymerase sigma-70 factor, ECF subfamily
VTHPEIEWLSKAQNGDIEAFSSLLEVYQKPVYNLCFRMLGDGYEAEDASQEVFLRAYKNIHRYDNQRSFSTWLLSIAAHYCIDQIRRRRFPLMSLDNDDTYLDPPDTVPGPEASLLTSENQQRVQALLSHLSAQDRAAVVMRYWYDFSYEEIAESLSLTVSAVKSRLHRARKALADEWSQQSSISKTVERKRHESPAF